MKNIFSVTLGILLLAIAGFASTDSGAPGSAPDAPVAVVDGVENHLGVALPPAPLRTVLAAKQCETRAAISALDDDDDDASSVSRVRESV